MLVPIAPYPTRGAGWPAGPLDVVLHLGSEIGMMIHDEARRGSAQVWGCAGPAAASGSGSVFRMSSPRDAGGVGSLAAVGHTATAGDGPHMKKGGARDE